MNFSWYSKLEGVARKIFQSQHIPDEVVWDVDADCDWPALVNRIEQHVYAYLILNRDKRRISRVNIYLPRPVATRVKVEQATTDTLEAWMKQQGLAYNLSTYSASEVRVDIISKENLS
ncbi:hypothetical protein AGMMS50289_04160 [Betaproteobacteria bacterium]|nr:hypothetical protein AGMMS50289_04160 [Betaproteobacteria bacterium]